MAANEILGDRRGKRTPAGCVNGAIAVQLPATVGAGSWTAHREGRGYLGKQSQLAVRTFRLFVEGML